MIVAPKTHNPWKTIAIIFIILFILETSFFIFSVYMVYEDGVKESKCSVDFCGIPSSEFDTYSFDSTDGTCVCYQNHEPKKQKIME